MEHIELIDALEKILFGQQLIAKGLMEEISAIRPGEADIQAIFQIYEKYLDDMDEHIFESQKTVRSLKVELGLEVENDDLDGLTTDEILDAGVGEMADCYGLHSAHIKFIIESMVTATGKYAGEILVRDIIATPDHYFRGHQKANDAKLKKVGLFIDWIKEVLKEREGESSECV